MSYEEQLKQLRKKTAKGRAKRGLSNRHVGFCCRQTMLNRRRYAHIWLAAAREWRLKNRECGREFAIERARRAITWAAEDRIFSERQARRAA